MAGLAGAQFLGLGWIPQEGVDLPCSEELQRVERGVGYPVEVLGGIEPDLGGHQRQLMGRGVVETDTLAFQVADASDTPLHEQLEAADMHPGEHGHRDPGFDLRKEKHRKVQSEIHLASPYRQTQRVAPHHFR